MSIGKDSYIIYRKQGVWSLSSIEDFWTSVGNAFTEPIGISEMKRLKGDYLTLSFDKIGVPKLAQITSISRYKSNNVFSVVGDKGFSILSNKEASFVKNHLENGLSKCRLEESGFIVKPKDLSCINYVFPRLEDMDYSSAYQLGINYKKVFGNNYNKNIVVSSNILFNPKISIVYAFIAGLIDAIGKNDGVGFYLPVKNQSVIAQVTFLLSRVGLQYSISSGIYINLVDNFDNILELRSHLKTKIKYYSSLKTHSYLNWVPCKGSDLFDYIKKTSSSFTDEQINYAFRKHGVKKKTNIASNIFPTLVKEFGLNKTNKLYHEFEYEEAKHSGTRYNDYIYDLFIDNLSHLYIAGNNGWCLLHNKKGARR